MKRMIILTALAVLLGVASASAQQIAVVTEGGETTVYQTLQAAIEGAIPGSVIYLPGGGFSISDDVKITKKLTIIGIGHKSNNDNEDGSTIITGNLWFNGGSSGSAVMGCYITGNVCIGHDDNSVNYILLKCCNVNAIDSRANCEDIVISQNYIRNSSPIRGCGCLVTNNILHSVYDMNSSTISYNIILRGHYYNYNYYVFFNVNNSNIYNNIIQQGSRIYYNTNTNQSNQTNRNMFINFDWGDNCINLTDCSWEDVFVDWNGGAVSPMSNFHFKEPYTQYESQAGVYANGVDFDNQIAPVPYIVAKRIAEETDAAGQLRIQVRVKASE